MENIESSNNFEESLQEETDSKTKPFSDDQIPAIVVLPALTKKHHKSYIEEVLDTQIGLNDLDEVFIKELNMPFPKIYRVISLLGVGAFGVVLEVENNINREISALKVPFTSI